jgi:putative DNA primase/helicase
MSASSIGPILSPLDQIEIESDLWLWPGRIPLGAITTIVGFGGEGKSFLACAVASALSRGGTFPDGSPAPQGAAVIMAGEDSPSKLRQRYNANGADLGQVKLLQGQRIYTKHGLVETNITLRDIDQIRIAIEQTPNLKLLIVDPIGDFIPGINSDKDNEVRAILNPLAQLAQERKLAVLMICHRKKGAGDRADSAALGSVAFTSKARAVHHVILDPYDTAHPADRRRLFLPGKMNDQKQTRGLAFKILAPDGVMEWEKDPITNSADAVMQYAAAKSRAERNNDPQALTETEAWLREALNQGPRRASDLLNEARLEGIPARTLRYAKLRLGVTHSRVAARGAYVWSPPASWAESSPGALPPIATVANVHESLPPLPPLPPTIPLTWAERVLLEHAQKYGPQTPSPQ